MVTAMHKVFRATLSFAELAGKCKHSEHQEISSTVIAGSWCAGWQGYRYKLLCQPELQMTLGISMTFTCARS